MPNHLRITLNCSINHFPYLYAFKCIKINYSLRNTLKTNGYVASYLPRSIWSSYRIRYHDIYIYLLIFVHKGAFCCLGEVISHCFPSFGFQNGWITVCVRNYLYKMLYTYLLIHYAYSHHFLRDNLKVETTLCRKNFSDFLKRIFWLPIMAMKLKVFQ